MRIYFWLILFLNAWSVFGQNQNLKFTRLLPENGLSHSFVTSIVQDKRGFMWFGTKDGLNKFDGYGFTVYKNDPDNANSLAHNFIQDLVIDKEGNLWIASWGGLSKFDLEKEVFTQYKHNKNDHKSIPNDLISSILEDEYGNLWLGTSGGLVLFDRENGSFTSYRHDKNDPESIGDDYVRDIIMDYQNKLWVGTYSGGLNLFDMRTGKFKRYMHDPNDPGSIGDNCAYYLFEDSKNRLWVGTHRNGFDLFNRETESFTHYKHDPKNENSVVHDVVTCFNEDRDGNLWVGTENGGISIFDPRTGTFYNHAQDDIDNTSLGNNSLYSIYRDVQGNMWLGTFASGVNFYSLESSRFQHFKHNSLPTSLSHNNVLCFYEDSRNNLWIGTDGGGANLYDRQTKKFTHFKHHPEVNSISGDYVLSITEDADGRIWFGTWGKGISVYDPVTQKFSYHHHDPLKPGSLGSDNVWMLYRSKDDNIWAGTYRGIGLELYDKKSDAFIHYSHDPNDPTSISNNYINSMYEDGKGNFWIGTSGGGLNLFDRQYQKFRSFQRDTGEFSLSSNNVDRIFEDSRGNLWLGTDLGLNMMDVENGRFITFTTKDGLPSNVICGILEDKKGLLWLSTTNGLSRFDCQSMSFTNYTIADGLQSQEFKPHAFLLSSTGAMYFGGINGFNEFMPDSISDLELDFPLYITNFKIFNRTVQVGAEFNGTVILSKALASTSDIILSHDLSFLSFEFASLNYTVPEKNQYAYMLEGYDKDWNYIGSSRLAAYTDVPPGKYTFKVKTSHNNGPWKEKEAVLNITITPPFWNTWLFKLVMVFLVIGTAFTFYSARIRAINAQKLALEEQVKARTLDLKEAAKEIELQRDSLKNANELVMSSINYANTIQKAILSSKETIGETSAEHFIIYKPKDVVSGDFYWFNHVCMKDLYHDVKDEELANCDQKFIAAVDCTGHGVPGAFMSIVGITLFNEVVNQKHIFDPAAILEMVDIGFRKLISPYEGINIAGMDVCLCRLEYLEGDMVRVAYAGARRPLFFVRKNSTEVERVNGDIISIGSDFKTGNNFHTHELILEKGSVLYLATDGYMDQNDPIRKKVSTAGFIKLLEACYHLPLAQQKEFLEEALAKHQQQEPQRDDITVVGVRI